MVVGSVLHGLEGPPHCQTSHAALEREREEEREGERRGGGEREGEREGEGERGGTERERGRGRKWSR